MQQKEDPRMSVPRKKCNKQKKTQKTNTKKKNKIQRTIPSDNPRGRTVMDATGSESGVNSATTA